MASNTNVPQHKRLASGESVTGMKSGGAARLGMKRGGKAPPKKGSKRKG